MIPECQKEDTTKGAFIVEIAPLFQNDYLHKKNFRKTCLLSYKHDQKNSTFIKIQNSEIFFVKFT